jgi:hypothetical protein
MAKQPLETLFEKYRYDKSIATKSKTWFEQQALLLKKRTGITPRKLLNQGQQTTRLVPGRLYMFFYDPKMKDTLPYYDTFPLVFPYAKVQGGFMGLNMHYLPYYYRVQLMTRLMQFATNTAFDETTKIRYSWSLISGASKFRFAEPCIKHYLNEHVESPFLEIPGQDWHTAMMLPVERFVKSNKNRVWGDSVSL